MFPRFLRPLLALGLAGISAQAAPILVYSFTLTGTKPIYFHTPLIDPATNKQLPLIYSVQKTAASQQILRDVANQTSVEIDTRIASGTKLYRISFNPASAGTTNPVDWTKVLNSSYASRVKLLSYPAGSTITTPGVHIEQIVRHTPNLSSFVSFTTGKEAVIRILKSTPPATVKAPLVITGSSNFWQMDWPDPNTTNYIPGTRVQTNPETATYKFSQTYTESVNSPDPTDPTTLTPGTLPYAAYRMVKILRKLGYVPG